MTRAIEFLKKCGVFYLATVEGDQPRVRPFGAVAAFEGRLYLITSNQKPVYAQLKANPKCELSGMAGGDWIRITAEAVEDERFEARKAVLDANPNLRGMYSENDGKIAVMWLKDAEAVIASFTAAPEKWTF